MTKVIALEVFFEHAVTPQDSEDLSEVVAFRCSPELKLLLRKLSVTQYGEEDISQFAREHFKKNLIPKEE